MKKSKPQRITSLSGVLLTWWQYQHQQKPGTLLEISWQTFKAMLADMGSSRNTRLAYENGVLEILTPFIAHENSNRVIEGFIGVLCEELQLEIKRTGSLTLTRDDLERGGEPDSSDRSYIL